MPSKNSTATGTAEAGAPASARVHVVGSLPVPGKAYACYHGTASRPSMICSSLSLSLVSSGHCWMCIVSLVHRRDLWQAAGHRAPGRRPASASRLSPRRRVILIVLIERYFTGKCTGQTYTSQTYTTQYKHVCERIKYTSQGLKPRMIPDPECRVPAGHVMAHGTWAGIWPASCCFELW